ncbi:MAG: hypothetical protein GY731_20180 [Gammaproteobacteria bacterium]|nr:hypothetical protein [Gammaproteobacteria bacterium]
MDTAALASVLADVRQDSNSDEDRFQPKFIDLHNLDIAPFQLESLEPPGYQSVLDNDSFVRSLDKLDQDLEDTFEKEEARSRIVTESAIGIAMSFSAGFVSWMLRAGSLLTSFLSVVPLWRQFDPLPILGAPIAKRRSARKDQKSDDESREDAKVETIFDPGKTG